MLAAYDLKAPFMSQSAFEETLAVGIDSLTAERDLRGFEPGKGWVHATAHGADLLKFLARNQKLARGAQEKLVRAVRDRLESAGPVFAWSEDARLAGGAAAAYAAVRAQVNTLTQLAAMLGREPDDKLATGSARSRRRSPGPRSDCAIRAERTAASTARPNRVAWRL